MFFCADLEVMPFVESIALYYSIDICTILEVKIVAATIPSKLFFHVVVIFVGDSF